MPQDTMSVKGSGRTTPPNGGGKLQTAGSPSAGMTGRNSAHPSTSSTPPSGGKGK